MLKAFEQFKAASLALRVTLATKVTLLFVEERLQEAQPDGRGFLSYGLNANWKTLEELRASIIVKACRRGWSRRKSCFTPARMSRSRS